MSLRPRQVAHAMRPLKQVHMQKETQAAVDANNKADSPDLRFDDLTPIEQAAASLGVQPFSYKPISAINDAYYGQLQKQNVLDKTLMRRIEAFKHVAQADTVAPKA